MLCGIVIVIVEMVEKKVVAAVPENAQIAEFSEVYLRLKLILEGGMDITVIALSAIVGELIWEIVPNACPPKLLTIS